MYLREWPGHFYLLDCRGGVKRIEPEISLEAVREYNGLL